MSESTAILVNWGFLFGLIALIFFIWRSYSRLAKCYHKEQWLFGLLGVSIFFTGIYTGTLIEPLLEKHIFFRNTQITVRIAPILVSIYNPEEKLAKKDPNIE